MKNVYVWTATNETEVVELIMGSEKSCTKKFRKWLLANFPEAFTEQELTAPLPKLKEMYYGVRDTISKRAYIVMYKSNHYFEAVV